jgi:mycofactocin system FadH/OYE family oxidoreductase 2
MTGEFKYLFTPLRIGRVTARNRILITAHVTNLASKDRLASEDLVYYYRERARGGVGLIVVESQCVHATAGAAPFAMKAYDKRAIPGYRMITDAVHEHGATVFGQLIHGGRQHNSQVTERELWAPSPIPCPFRNETPHEMTVEEIQEVIEAFGCGAEHLRAGGFDGVEIHGAHGYLITQFMSPFSNKRTDQYGGSLDNRLRFVLEVIDSVRSAAGDDFVVGIRISGDEFTDSGLTLDDMKVIAQQLADTGQVDYISVSQCNYNSIQTMMPDMSFPLAPFAYLAAGIKEVVPHLPIFTIARITDPLQAEQLLANGQADMIGMTRANVCDPELANKAREGRLDEIRTCMGCNQGCVHRVFLGFPISCVQNPAAGKEKELGVDTIKPAGIKKRVMVVGGGPGGMAAARMAALRGHEVTLLEKGPELGGRVNLASKLPKRQELEECVRFLGYELERLGVEVKLGVEVTPEMVEGEMPKAVIVATGSIPTLPEIPGVDTAQVFTTWDVLQDRKKVGQKILLISEDGAFETTGTAEFLAERGKKVQVVTNALYVGNKITPISLIPLYQRLFGKGVTLTPSTVVRSISGKRVTMCNPYSGEEREIDGVDTVVIAGCKQADDGLFRSLKSSVGELYAVGDCVAPRTILEAIREGYLAGRAV